MNKYGAKAKGIYKKRLMIIVVTALAVAPTTVTDRLAVSET